VKTLLLLILLLQDGPIVFPDLTRPVPPPPPPVRPERVDAFSVEDIYLIESDLPLHVLASPSGVVEVEQEQQGTVIRGKFAGGNGLLERRKISRTNGYLVTAAAPGQVELIVLPAAATETLEVRRVALRVVGRADPSPEPERQQDAVAQAFRAYEAAWRQAQTDLADRLDSGLVTSESDAADWFATANTEARKQAFTPLLQSEQGAFGGIKWTAAGHAQFIRRYASNAK
jgi:hypothetical protein